MRVRHRFLGFLTLTSLVVAAAMAVGSIALLRSAVKGRFVERIRSETALLSAWIEEPGETEDLQGLAVRASQRLGLRVTFIDEDGIVRGDSSRSLESLGEMDNHIDRPEVAGARLLGTGQSFRTSDTTNVEYLYVARVVEGQAPVKYVRLALPSSEVSRVQARYTGMIVAVVPAAMLLMAGVGYLAVRRLSRPVERMADAVERSAGGDLEIAPPRSGGEEIDRLGTAVRQMQQELLEKIAQLDSERALFSSVVSGMQEGLLLVGADGHVKFCNEVLRKTLALEVDPQGRPLAEAVRHPEAIREIESVLSGDVGSSVSTIKFAASGRSFQLRVTPLRDPGDEGSIREVLVLFFDISRMERLEAVRREFVANVSHELRTPLTSIKAFVETLAEGGVDDEANVQRFLGIIRKHADRMGELIADLTDLSLIETGAIALHIEEVDATKVVEGVVERLEPLANRQEVDILVELESPFPIGADRRRLEQMLTNLLDNAVKFSHKGGQVRVRGRLNGSGTTLSVKDEGVGIPRESLEKVFHRFHQENRERSRELGGTGLGLAIVKHLMRLHGGSVRVESELGFGSEFFLEFPARA